MLYASPVNAAPHSATSPPSCEMMMSEESETAVGIRLFDAQWNDQRRRTNDHDF